MATEKKLLRTREGFVTMMQQELMMQKPHTKLTVEKLAATFGIKDKTEVKELTELAIVRSARIIAGSEGTIQERYDKMVTLYKSQVNLSHRTSMSMLLQQYSTPAPIGYLMGIFTGLDKLYNGDYGFEPSAGNGLLTIAGDPRYITVNEVDELRRRNLETQGFKYVWNSDASEPFPIQHWYRAVVTNPPFGTLRKPVYFGTYKIDTLDGLMVLRALDTMVNNGRAAVIMGGHTTWDSRGRIQSGRNRIFFNYLYSRYHVVDIININGKQLYSRMGTAFNTRIILIAGRKNEPEGVAPLYNPEKDKVVNTFEELYARIMEAMDTASKTMHPYLSAIAQQYEQKYLPMMQRYPGKIVLLSNKDNYEVFGDDALTVMKITKRSISAQFLYHDQVLSLLRLPREGRQWIDDDLRRSGKSYVMIDELENPAALSQQKKATMSTYAEKYKHYRKVERMLEIDPRFDEIMVYQEGSTYEVYGQAVPYLCRNFDLMPEEEFLYGRKVIEVVRIPEDRVREIKGQLEKDKFRVVIYDNTPEKTAEDGMTELEQEALAFLKRLEDEGLGGSLWPLSDYQLSLEYSRLEKQFKGELIFLKYRELYHVFSDNAALLHLVLQMAPKTSVQFGNEVVVFTYFRKNELAPVLQRLSEKNFHYCVLSSELGWIEQSSLNRHRQEGGKEIWEQTLNEFLMAEQVNHRNSYNIKQSRHRAAGKIRPEEADYYILPYEPQYVALFNLLITGREYEPTQQNPFSLSVIEEDLCGWKYAEVCLRIIHFYEIHVAIDCGNKIPKQVMRDYPEFKRAWDELKWKDRKIKAPYNTIISLLYSLDWSFLTRNGKLLNKAWITPPNPDSLGAPYLPASDACVVLDTQVPDSMAFETQQAVEQIEQAVGGDIDNFVRDRLGYRSKVELCKALSAEQIDAVAMAIYNIEARGQGMVIGDQTGIGKGRVAASMIRYACQQGLTPVFITEKANLFSDIYRDLAAIGSGQLRPFIVNAQESKSDIKDEDGHVLYRALPPAEQQAVFTSQRVPVQYDFVCATYSQFNSAEKKPLKPSFLKAIAEDNILIMDEAHNSSGGSQTGMFLQEVVRLTRGVTFLSATFAKRPDNMPIYALRTAISDSNLDSESLIYSIRKGGVALQEILSAQLVQEGQMLRRERSYDGVEVNYITLEDRAAEHWAISDNITQVIRDIISFQKDFIGHEIAQLDEEKAKEGEEVALREGTSEAGVDNEPYFSKVFQVINQMLFSLKAEAVAERAIMRLKEGKKPVIAFASTMGSFIEDLIAGSGQPFEEGITINMDFSQVLRKGLEGVLRYTVYEPDGTPSHHKFDVKELPLLAQIEYKRISSLINSVSTGITISPIDVVIKRIREAGYTVAEVTGRKYTLELDDKGTTGTVTIRQRLNTNDAFRLFNNNQADVLLINQAGSTGASAHAIATAKVPATEVKQRVMIVQQPELDINTEVQKRGRINRTGQLYKPIYDYISTAIPAEMRLMMILQKKLKSLDANTTSNQKQSTKILNVPDFLNKFGDEVVGNYLGEHQDINKLLDYPVRRKSASNNEGEIVMEDAASKTCGRVAVLSAKMQQEFYNEVSNMYDEYVDYLKQTGDYDLEVEAMNLEAETEATSIVKMGKGAQSVFGKDSLLERVKVNVLKKPFTPTELNNILNESLNGRTPADLRQELRDEFQKYGNVILEEEQEDINQEFDRLIKGIQSERKIIKLAEDVETWRIAIATREKELEEERRKKLAMANKKAGERKFYLNRILPYFMIGQSLYYPIQFGTDTELIPTVFLGYQIDWKKKNPFAPSNIKLRFALADSHKYLVIPASNKEKVMAVMGASETATPPDRFALLDKWEQWIKQGSVDRQTRYIITGNLLQAFADHPGKLISYTTIDQQIKKGILLPEHWNPKEQLEDKVTVPVIKALLLIQSLTQGNSIVTNTGIGFYRESSYSFRIIVSASRSIGGDIFLQEDILKLVNSNNFEKRSDKMVASISADKLPELVQVIQRLNNCAVSIPYSQLKYIPQDEVFNTRKVIQLPAPEPTGPTPEEEELALLELEAEAVTVTLTLELELYGKAA